MKRLIALMALVLLSLQGSSQGSQIAHRAINDSTCLPNSQLRAALKLIEQGKQCEHELIMKERQLEIMEGRVVLKDSIISTLYERLTIAANIRETYEREVNLFSLENEGLRLQVDGLRKDLKKQKRKTFIARIGIVAVGALATYIILKP